MRAAVCLSGEARFAESNYEVIKRQIVDSAGNPDVFCFFWDRIDERLGIDPYRAVELYKPTDYKIVPQKVFDTGIIDSRPSVESDGKTLVEHKELLYWKFQRISSMFYAIQQADLLRGDDYDCVIRCRTDIAFNSGGFSLNSFEQSRNSLGCFRIIPFEDAEYPQLRDRYGDEFWFGNSQVMRKMCSLYDSIPIMIEKLNCLRPDHFVSYYVENILGAPAFNARMGAPTVLLPPGGPPVKDATIGKPRRYW